jgi:DNA-binding SARP family transcriptional activator
MFSRRTTGAPARGLKSARCSARPGGVRLPQPVDFRLLGPLEVAGDGDGGPTAPIGTGRQRARLALLVLHANETLTSDRLIGELWGESPPPSAVKMLHNQISALRRALGDGRLETHGHAYRLAVRPGERDLDRFDDLVTRGRAALDADPEGAAELLRRALALWRGPPLADLAYEPFAIAEIGRLEERRWTAFEMRIDAELALGRHAEAVPELEAAVTAQPPRERLHGRLMLALYRSGRQAEALQADRRARRTLVDEIGVEPGAPLGELHGAILAQDPALGLPAGLEELPAELDRERRRCTRRDRARRPGRAPPSARRPRRPPPLAALAIAGSAGLPVAQAGPLRARIAHATPAPDLRVHMHTSSLARTTSPSQELSSPDALDAAAGRYLGSTAGVPTPPAATPASDRPDWTGIALGAVGGAGFVVVLIGAGSVAVRRTATH